MEKDWKFILKFFQQFLFILRIKSNLLLKDLCLPIIHHLKPLFSLLLPGEATTHFSILAWRIPWTEEPDKLQSTGSQRVGHDWATNISGQVNYDFSTTKAWFLCLPIPPRWNIFADSHQVGLKVFFKVSKINLPFLIIFILWIKVQRYWDSLHTLINPCWIMYSNFYLKI